ncbi:MAG: DegQ family serine endoprotease [Thermodesulfobacteriota bacterium]|nr:DegQ family serine endoprotease [Thermodesulfobacteriota bacterium]
MKIAKKITTCIMALSFVVLLLGLAPHTALSKASDQITMIPNNFTELAQKAKPGVVNIRTVKIVKGGGRVFRHFFGKPFGDNDRFRDFLEPFMRQDPQREFKQRSLGSGFIIDRKGYIVTNNHVVENADQIKVKLANEKEFDAKIVGRDPKTDLALIKIDASSDLVPLKMGNSDVLKVGTWVVAIGSPFGLEQTVTAGIVSAKGRILGSGPYDDFIQTDASINPGNSGGPLLNMKGEVVGINTAIIASGQGIGFAIPINMADGIVAQLKASGEVTRGWLGVAIQDLTPELAEYYKVKNKKGVLVTHVFAGDPADKGGVKAKDIIVKIDGKPVPTAHELSSTIAGIAVGKKIAILLIRDGREKTLYIKIAKRQDDESLVSKKTESSNGLGLMASELNPETARQLGYEESEKGVIVTGVKEGSKAEQAGIRQGDLIKEINRRPVSTLNDYHQKMRKISKGETIQLLIKRSRVGFMVIKVIK